MPSVESVSVSRDCLWSLSKSNQSSNLPRGKTFQHKEVSLLPFQNKNVFNTLNFLFMWGWLSAAICCLGGCWAFILGDIWEVSGQGPGQPALADPISQVGWTRWCPEAPFNLSHSVIKLWTTFCCWNHLPTSSPYSHAIHVLPIVQWQEIHSYRWWEERIWGHSSCW